MANSSQLGYLQLGVANLGSVGSAAASSAYNYRTITIDHTKVGGSDLTNYPLLVSGVYSYLATLANGGKVTSASGYDIQFFSDSALTTPLKFEREYWVATTGEFVAWVKVPSVSASVDTVIYWAYGNAAVTTDQSDKVNVWDANYLNVYHFGNGTTLNLTDSTANAFTLSSAGGPSATAGKVDGAINFDGFDDNTVTTGVSSPASITAQWWNFVASGDQKESAAFFYGANMASTTDRASAHTPWSDSNLYWDFGNATNTQGRTTTSYAAYLSAWTHIALVFDDATDFHAIYLNGALIQSHTHSSSSTAGKTPLSIGNSWDGISAKYIKGKVDEFRISNIARSAGWILADYNNQNSPSTFYTVGSEVGGSAGVTASASAASMTFTAPAITVTVTGSVVVTVTAVSMTFTALPALVVTIAAASAASLTFTARSPGIAIFNPLPPSDTMQATNARRGVDKGFHLIPLTPYAVEVRRAVSGDPAASSAGSGRTGGGGVRTQQQWRPVAEAFEIQQRNNDRLRDELVNVRNQVPPRPPGLAIEVRTFVFPGELVVADGLHADDGVLYVVITVPDGFRASVYEAFANVSDAPSGQPIECNLYVSPDYGVTWTDTILNSPLTIPAGDLSSGPFTDFTSVPYFLAREDRLRLSIDQVGGVTPGAGLVVSVRYQIVTVP
jgi:hypothetical protein